MPTRDQVGDPENRETRLPPEHRESMLELVLVWASLDGALGMLVSGVERKPLHQIADELSKANGSTKLNRIIKGLPDDEKGKSVKKALRKWKKQYEQHSRPRNRICHAHCAGHLKSDPRYLVFAVFEQEGEGLAVEAIPLEEIETAKKWGEQLRDFCLSVFDRKFPTS